jgi:hypothetical protein
VVLYGKVYDVRKLFPNGHRHTRIYMKKGNQKGKEKKKKKPC